MKLLKWLTWLKWLSHLFRKKRKKKIESEAELDKDSARCRVCEAIGILQAYHTNENAEAMEKTTRHLISLIRVAGSHGWEFSVVPENFAQLESKERELILAILRKELGKTNKNEVKK